MNVNNANIAYNIRIYQPISSKIVDVPAGAKMGVMCTGCKQPRQPNAEES